MKIYYGALITFALSFCCFLSNAFAQKQANIWYFGDKAGINFNVNPPLPLTNSAMVASRGCASICDKNGNLALYTNGQSVWNSYHTVLTNGTGLFGGFASTQAALIVPHPGNDSIYYIFTRDSYVSTNKGLHYSVVDVTKQAVTKKISCCILILLKN